MNERTCRLGHLYLWQSLTIFRIVASIKSRGRHLSRPRRPFWILQALRCCRQWLRILAPLGWYFPCGRQLGLKEVVRSASQRLFQDLSRAGFNYQSICAVYGPIRNQIFWHCLNQNQKTQPPFQVLSLFLPDPLKQDTLFSELILYPSRKNVKLRIKNQIFLLKEGIKLFKHQGLQRN